MKFPADGWRKRFPAPNPYGLPGQLSLLSCASRRVCGHFHIPSRPAKLRTLSLKWLERPGVAILDPGERHWGILSNLMISAQASGPLVTDAHLAALAIEHGATLCTNDRDFARFPGLRIFNPLEHS